MLIILLVILHKCSATALAVMMLVLLLRLIGPDIRIGRVLPPVIKCIFRCFCLFGEALLRLRCELVGVGARWTTRRRLRHAIIRSILIYLILDEVFGVNWRVVGESDLLPIRRSIRKPRALFLTLLVHVLTCLLRLSILLNRINIIIIAAIDVVLCLILNSIVHASHFPHNDISHLIIVEAS